MRTGVPLNMEFSLSPQTFSRYCDSDANLMAYRKSASNPAAATPLAATSARPGCIGQGQCGGSSPAMGHFLPRRVADDRDADLGANRLAASRQPLFGLGQTCDQDRGQQSCDGQKVLPAAGRFEGPLQPGLHVRRDHAADIAQRVDRGDPGRRADAAEVISGKCPKNRLRRDNPRGGKA